MKVSAFTIALIFTIGFSGNAQESFFKFQFPEQGETYDYLTSNLIALPDGRLVWGTLYHDTSYSGEGPFGSLSLCDPDGENLLCSGVGGGHIDYLQYHPIDESIISLNSETIRGIANNGYTIEWNKKISTQEIIRKTGIDIEEDGYVIVGMSGNLNLYNGTIGYTKFSTDFSNQENVFFKLENLDISYVESRSEWSENALFHFGHVELFGEDDPYILIAKISDSLNNSWYKLVNGSSIAAQFAYTSFRKHQDYLYLIENQNILKYSSEGNLLNSKHVNLSIGDRNVELVNKQYLFDYNNNIYLVSRGYFFESDDDLYKNYGVAVVKMDNSLDPQSGFFHEYPVLDNYLTGAELANNGIYLAAGDGNKTIISRIDLSDLGFGECPIYEMDVIVDELELPEVISADLINYDFDVVLSDTAIVYNTRDFSMHTECEALSLDDRLLDGANISIYPNPNNTGNLNFQLDKHLKPCQAFISSLSGNRIHSFEVPGSQANFSVKLPVSLAAGLYMIEIPDYRVRKKLIIQ